MRKIAILSAASAAAFANPGAAAPAAAKTTKPKAPAAPRVEPVFASAEPVTLALPSRSSRRGSVSLYPFKKLTAVGMAFGVKNKTAANLSSIVSNANRKAMVQELDVDGKPVFETKTINAPDGSHSEVPDISKPKMTATAHYFAIDAAEFGIDKLKGTALEGSSVIVFRDK